jgi:DNA-binding NarL/FixJ family response regulator
LSTILLIDDAAALAELFGKAIETQLGHTVKVVVALTDVEDALDELDRLDLALVDLSFNQERGTGLDALALVHRARPDAKLAIYTQGDAWVADVLRDAWALLPITTVISKSAPLDYQLSMITQVLTKGSAPPDPAIQPLLPSTTPGKRSPQSFARLVQHAGHAKMWNSLLAVDDATYKALADHSGLKLNTLKNYRAQIVPELAHHGLQDPSLREMREFAVRSRPFLMPYVEAALDGH